MTPELQDNPTQGHELQEHNSAISSEDTIGAVGNVAAETIIQGSENEAVELIKSFEDWLSQSEKKFNFAKPGSYEKAIGGYLEQLDLVGNEVDYISKAVSAKRLLENGVDSSQDAVKYSIRATLERNRDDWTAAALQHEFPEKRITVTSSSLKIRNYSIATYTSIATPDQFAEAAKNSGLSFLRQGVDVYDEKSFKKYGGRIEALGKILDPIIEAAKKKGDQRRDVCTGYALSIGNVFFDNKDNLRRLIDLKRERKQEKLQKAQYYREHPDEVPTWDEIRDANLMQTFETAAEGRAHHAPGYLYPDERMFGLSDPEDLEELLALEQDYPELSNF
jgi:hypothetical protein